MNPRSLTLLSPYRLPTDSTLYLGDEEVTAILNGHAALWHPAALLFSARLPRIDQPHEHEEPTGEQIYALPDNPPLMLADDWADRAKAAGAVVFTATRDRAETIRNLLDALRQAAPEDEQFRRVAEWPVERVGPFLGVGYGVAVLSALFEEMSHDNALSLEELHRELTAAARAGDAEESRRNLQAAADRLLTAREVLYPVTLHAVDLFLVDPADPGANWPLALEAGLPLNVVASGELIERLAREQPGRLSLLREKVAADLVEVLGGVYREREDPLLPVESQLWNLLKAQAVYREHLGREVSVFARRRSGFHAQLPLLLHSAGVTHALLVAFDDALVPTYQTVVVSWPSHDGKQVEAFTRSPQPAESAQTWFHLAHHLHQTIMQDQSATLALSHKGLADAPSYEDWLELTRLAPVLGRPATLSGYFGEVMAGDYTTAASPDEFHADYLGERAASDSPARETPVSGLAEQVRERRWIDAAWTFTAVLRSLGGTVPEVEGRPFVEHLAAVEDRFERGAPPSEPEASAREAATLAYASGSVGLLVSAQQHAAEALARRLVARGKPNSPGWLLLNPCSFTRRVAVELPGLLRPVPSGGPVKACQIEGGVARLVVEVPPLGFAWVPKEPPEGPVHTTRMRLAEERAGPGGAPPTRFVRNEFFEAEIDPQTGGLKTVRDTKRRIGRLGQQLVWNPGSVMQARRIEVTSTGPALGEVYSEGVLLDDAGEELAAFSQRFRAWLGRPLLELRVELEPRKPADGYAWHAYYGARFAWREESATLVRGCTGLRSMTSQNRPETPDYLELQMGGRQNTALFPGGLPFHQRHGGRMLDVLLVCEGERARAFELGIGVDREQPMQTALGVVSPVAVVPLEQGPPHVGATGWLYHLDASNVLLTSLRPVADHENALVATMLECSSAGGQAQFRCVRDPVRALLQDLRGNALIDVSTQGDAVDFEVSANDLLQLRVEFS
jgi:alpha-mannosidase